MDGAQLRLLEDIARAVGVTTAVSGITVGKLYMAYRETRPRGRAWQLERNLLRPFVVKHWRAACSSLSADTWEEHRRRRRKQKTRKGKPPQENTLNIELVRTKGMFRWGHDSERIRENPLRKCKPVKTKTRRESWFTAEQIQTLIDGAEHLRWHHQRTVFRAIVTVMADTGLRISEALSLRWDRITSRGTSSVIGKGGQTRVVAFTPRAMEAMESLGRHHSNPKVFLNWKRWTVYSPWTIGKWFKKVIDATGLHCAKADGDLALVPHILRHSFASRAEELGASPLAIQRAMGHLHQSTTKIYLHRDDADSAVKMAALMSVRQGPRRSVHKKTELPPKEFAQSLRSSVTSSS